MVSINPPDSTGPIDFNETPRSSFQKKLEGNFVIDHEEMLVSVNQHFGEEKLHNSLCVSRERDGELELREEWQVQPHHGQFSFPISGGDKEVHYSGQIRKDMLRSNMQVHCGKELEKAIEDALRELEARSEEDADLTNTRDLLLGNAQEIRERFDRVDNEFSSLENECAELDKAIEKLSSIEKDELSDGGLSELVRMRDKYRKEIEDLRPGRDLAKQDAEAVQACFTDKEKEVKAAAKKLEKAKGVYVDKVLEGIYALVGDDEPMMSRILQTLHQGLVANLNTGLAAVFWENEANADVMFKGGSDAGLGQVCCQLYKGTGEAIVGRVTETMDMVYMGDKPIKKSDLGIEFPPGTDVEEKLESGTSFGGVHLIAEVNYSTAAVKYRVTGFTGSDKLEL